MFFIINAEPIKKVYINQIVEHPALTETIRGIKDALKDKNCEIKVESAQGNAILSGQIAGKFVAQNADVVVGIGTVAAQSFIKYAREGKTKLIFSSVTDPQSAGLTGNSNISGISNFVEIKPQLELFKKLQPTLKRIGFLYNPGESNSISLIKKLEILCPQLGLTLVLQEAFKTSDIPLATAKLVTQVDAIFISNDNTALSAIANVIQIAKKSKIPVYVSDTDAVKVGALAGLGPNQYQVGIQTGQMIARYLKGESLDKMPIEYPNKTETAINKEMKAELGL